MSLPADKQAVVNAVALVVIYVALFAVGLGVWSKTHPRRAIDLRLERSP